MKFSFFKNNLFKKRSKEQENNRFPYPIASFNRKIIASTIDVFLIVLIFSSPIMKIIYYTICNFTTGEEVIKQVCTCFYNGDIRRVLELVPELQAKNLEFNIGVRWVLTYIVPFLLVSVAVVAFWKWKGATPGKIVARCVILDSDVWQPITLKQCIMRCVGLSVSMIIAFLGFFTLGIGLLAMTSSASTASGHGLLIAGVGLGVFILGTGILTIPMSSKKQPLHDIIAKTVVVFKLPEKKRNSTNLINNV
ncbi:putative RDD domain-containing protein [Alphaproteobacteria bacterium]